MELKIKLNGKIYRAASPKAKVWRSVIKFDEIRTDLKTEDFIEAHAGIIAEAFAVPEVTTDAILDNLNIDEIVPLYFETFRWICELLNRKLKKIPNEETPTKE